MRSINARFNFDPMHCLFINVDASRALSINAYRNAGDACDNVDEFLRAIECGRVANVAYDDALNALQHVDKRALGDDRQESIDRLRSLLTGDETRVDARSNAPHLSRIAIYCLAYVRSVTLLLKRSS